MNNQEEKLFESPETKQDQSPVDTAPLSERDLKMAHMRALQQRKEVIKRNKELIADKQLEVAYWKAEADLLRYRYELMDFYLKNLEIESKYKTAKLEQEKLLEQEVLDHSKPTA